MLRDRTEKKMLQDCNLSIASKKIAINAQLSGSEQSRSLLVSRGTPLGTSKNILQLPLLRSEQVEINCGIMTVSAKVGRISCEFC